MPILLVTLVITHFLTLVAQLQQAVVGPFSLLSMVVEILTRVGKKLQSIKIDQKIQLALYNLKNCGYAPVLTPIIPNYKMAL